MLLLIVIVAVSFVLLLAGLSAEMTVAGMVLWGTAMFAAWFPALRLYRLREGGGEAEGAAADILAYLDRQPAITQVADAQPLGRLARHPVGEGDPRQPRGSASARQSFP